MLHYILVKLLQPHPIELEDQRDQEDFKYMKKSAWKILVKTTAVFFSRVLFSLRFSFQSQILIQSLVILKEREELTFLEFCVQILFVFCCVCICN